MKKVLILLFLTFILYGFPQSVFAEYVLYPSSFTNSSYSPSKTLNFIPDTGGCTDTQTRNILDTNNIRFLGTLKCTYDATRKTWQEENHSTCGPGCTTTHFIGQVFRPAAVLSSGFTNGAQVKINSIELSGQFKIGDQYGHKGDPVTVRVSLYTYSGNETYPRGNLITSTNYTFEGGTGNRSSTLITLPTSFTPIDTTLYLEITQINYLFDDHIIWLPTHNRWTTSDSYKSEQNNMFDNGSVYTTGIAYAGNVSRNARFQEDSGPIYDTNSKKTDDDLAQITIMGDVLDAACDSITPPQDPNLPAGQVYPNATYTASFDMRNTGSIGWEIALNHRLGSQDSENNTNWTYNRVAPTRNTEPGIRTRFTSNFISPSTPGTYNFNWKMLQEDIVWFGQKCTSSITVSGLPTPIPTLAPFERPISTPTPTPTPTPIPSSLDTPQATPLTSCTTGNNTGYVQVNWNSSQADMLEIAALDAFQGGTGCRFQGNTSPYPGPLFREWCPATGEYTANTPSIEPERRYMVRTTRSGTNLYSNPAEFWVPRCPQNPTVTRNYTNLPGDCLTGPSSDPANILTISWNNTYGAVTAVDISSDRNFPVSNFYRKNITSGTTSTGVPVGFKKWTNPWFDTNPPLTINPSTVYYVRLYEPGASSLSDYSYTTTFLISACPSCDAGQTCGNWTTMPNTCYPNNSSRTCTNTTSTTGNPCTLNSYPVYRSESNCTLPNSCVSNICVTPTPTPGAWMRTSGGDVHSNR